MTKRLSKVVWAALPGSLCNLNCSYCYVGDKKGDLGEYVYPVKHMLKCFDPKRFGGPISFEGTGVGETLLWPEIVDFTQGMLLHGHVVTYNTNLTITPVIEKFCNLNKELRSRLVLAVSLHYLELKRKKLLDKFLANLRMLKSAEISFSMGICISDSIIPHLQEINELFKKEIGLLPLAQMIRTYDRNGGKIARAYSHAADKLVKETCDVRAWNLEKFIFGSKRNEFCLAGESSIDLHLGTGDYAKCWGSNGLGKKWREIVLEKNESKLLKKIPLVKSVTYKLFKEPRLFLGNMFKNPNEPIKFGPIGECPFYDCVCAEFQCWGLIPELNVGTFSGTYLTKGFVSNEAWDLMDSKIVPY